ncbi:hypothetical protein HJB89_15025 [Rhizobium sp. NZLR8]|nr:hypothetical protein [Rhizobium sp. NZLR8]
MSEERVVHRRADFFAIPAVVVLAAIGKLCRVCRINFIDRHMQIFYLESFKKLGHLPQLMVKQRVSIDARTSGRQERPRDTGA